MSDKTSEEVVPVELLKELRIEGAIVPNRRGELYRDAAEEIQRLRAERDEARKMLTLCVPPPALGDSWDPRVRLAYVSGRLEAILPCDDDNRPVEAHARKVVAHVAALRAYAVALRAVADKVRGTHLRLWRQGAHNNLGCDCCGCQWDTPATEHHSEGCVVGMALDAIALCPDSDHTAAERHETGKKPMQEAQERIQRDMATKGTARAQDVFTILGDPSKGVTVHNPEWPCRILGPEEDELRHQSCTQPAPGGCTRDRWDPKCPEHGLESPIVKARIGALEALAAIEKRYLDIYEFTDGETFDETPDERERMMIEFAIAGLHGDEEFVAAWDAWRELCGPDRIVHQVSNVPTFAAWKESRGGREAYEGHCVRGDHLDVILEAAFTAGQRTNPAIDFERRVFVEQRLLDAYTGKKPLPTREECRELAHRLGIPDELRSVACNKQQENSK